MRKRYVAVFQFSEQGSKSLEHLLHCLDEEGYRLQTVTPPARAGLSREENWGVSNGPPSAGR